MLKRLVPLAVIAFGFSHGAGAQPAASEKKVPAVALAAKNGVQRHYIDGAGSHSMPPPNWGLIETSWTRLGATEFDPDNSSTTYTSTWFPEGLVYSYQRYVTGGYAHLIGFGHVPGGSNVDGVNINYCETNSSGPFASITWYFCDPNGGCTTPAFASYDFGFFGTGCHDVAISGLTATMNNADNELLVDVKFAHSDGSESIASAGLAYNLQISAPPGVATFSDVPTNDGAFPFVEALVKAGVTVGCDAGPPARYCPDDPVTRRQMAVFISKALGLDWPGY
jgi:hypothetical protein